MKKFMLFIFVMLVALLGACSQNPVSRPELNPQAGGGSSQPPSTWVGLGNSVYSGTNPNNYPARFHRDIEVVSSSNGTTLAYLEWNSVTPGIETFMRSDLVVSQWNDTTKTWNKLGTSVDATDDDVANFSLAVRGQKMVVAYDLCGNLPDNNCDSGSHTTYIKQWTGTAWQQLGGVFCQGSGGCHPQIAFDSGGNPVLLIYNPNPNILTSLGVTVHRWNSVNSSWVQLGGKLNTYDYVPHGSGGSGGQDLQLVIDNQGHPVVAFAEGEDYDTTGYLQVKRWNGSSWQTFGLFSAVATTPQTDNYRGYSLALSTGTTPVVAYSVYENGSQLLRVRVLSTCSNPYLNAYPCWKTLGDQAKLGAGQYPEVISYGSSDYTFSTSYALAYQNNNNLYVKSLRGGNWELVGTNPLDVTLNYKIEAHALTYARVARFSANTTTATYVYIPLVAWLEPNDPMNHKKLSKVYAKRYQ
jgi:hypothetical protein